MGRPKRTTPLTPKEKFYRNAEMPREQVDALLLTEYKRGPGSYDPAATAKKKLKLIAEAEAELMKAKLKHELPHIFGFKPYRWTLEYWHSKNRMKFITAGNQLSKSSTQIRHAIDLATDKSKWPEYFPKWVAENKGVAPVFWYIYPNKTKVLEEWDKWEREFLPRGSMKDDETYGWSIEYDKEGIPSCLRFNSGAVIWFKTWHQDLQAGTLAAIFIDEEIPANLWPELAMRVSRYDGMISMVFTATLNQPFFYDVMERRGQPDERFPQADKWQISMEYDCRYYADGTPSPWTPEEVAKQKAKCGSEEEINRRIHGRFVSSQGRRFPSFVRARNMKPGYGVIDRSWDFYAGVDIGTSGDGHPAAIVIVAVRPDYKYARVVRVWKGPRDEYTNTSQILQKYLELTRDIPISRAFYDYHSKEFWLRAQEAGVPFEPADKSREFGIDLINVLFKNKMLDIDSDAPQAEELATELENLRIETKKVHAEDDVVDALRYAVSKIPFDFSDITGEVRLFEHTQQTKIKTLDEIRIEQAEQQMRGLDSEHQNDWGYESEISEYNDLLDY